MKLWVLYKSYEECWYFFSRQLTWLGSQFSFQILPDTIQIHPVCVPSCGQSVTWIVVYLLIQLSEPLICWLESDLYMQSPEALAFINIFVLLSWISLPSTFGFPEASLFIPLAKSSRFSYPMLSCTSLTACTRANWQEDNAKGIGVHSTLLEPEPL